MKNKKSKKIQNVTKGMPSAVVLSILIHAGLFLLAGMLVVFTVVKKKEIEFEPPKAVERPKMKLKKPKVKVKKTSKPKPTTRIVTKMNRASMPDIQLPEMSGMGDGLGDGMIGGFDVMPDLGEVTVFGSGQTVGNDLKGTFYDFKSDRRGKPLSVSLGRDNYRETVIRFLKNDWKPSVFSRFYRSPKPLYATMIAIPPLLATEAPAAFGEPDIGGWFWVIHYKGNLTYSEDITFRFWGAGDAIMFVRVDGEMVLSCPHHSLDADYSQLWRIPDPANTRRYWLGDILSVPGNWITLKAGEMKSMEVLIGADPGGIFESLLLVEVKGVKYPKTRQGGPLLPFFKTAEPSHDQLDFIYRSLVPDEASPANGPIFSDYDTAPVAITNRPDSTEPPDPILTLDDVKKEMRQWTTTKGKTFKAEFVAIIAGKVVLKNRKGKTKRIPLGELSEEDRSYVELMQPPTFNIDLAKKTSLWHIDNSPYASRIPPPNKADYTFTAKIKQQSTGDYDHKLKVEIFAFGREYMGDKFVLLTRQEGSFVPSEEPNRFFSLTTEEKATIYVVNLYGDKRGTKYYGYLVVLTDERGVIIQHAESNKWLFESLGNLRNLKAGNYLDKTGKRVYPSSPRALFFY